MIAPANSYLCLHEPLENTLIKKYGN